MEDQVLTPHFKLSEFQNSPTANKLGIDNTIPKEYIPRLTAICQEILEPLRAYAEQPIIIGSGYRCKALNKAVGGVKNSQHLTGEAVDIHIPDTATGNKWFLWMMENLKFDQLIKERNTKTSKNFWIHVSLRSTSTGSAQAQCKQRQHVICNLIKSKSK